jgi:hypothetical protein
MSMQVSGTLMESLGGCGDLLTCGTHENGKHGKTIQETSQSLWSCVKLLYHKNFWRFAKILQIWDLEEVQTSYVATKGVHNARELTYDES